MNNLISNPAYLLLLLAFLTLAPLFLMMVTSFVKVSIVFSILRNAMGTQQIPPNVVLMGFSLILTFYIMHPVAMDMKDKIREDLDARDIKNHDSWWVLQKCTDSALPVLKDFLNKNSHPDVKTMFIKLSPLGKGNDQHQLPAEDDLIILVPSFVVSELQESFEIGVLIYLPFLIIDVLVSSILVSMGMHMLSPVTISLPFKLLVFVLADGWEVLTRGLIIGYKY